MKNTEIIHVGGRKKLRTGSIVHFIANENYTNIYMADGTHYIVAKTLKEIEAKTNQHKNFIRPNRSTIINTDFADLQGKIYTLPDKRKVVFSRRRWKEFVRDSGRNFNTNKTSK